MHFPTDINLLWDACRKAIKLTATLCRHYAVSDWRQFRYALKKIKTAYLLAQRSKRSKAKNSKEQVFIRHREYIGLCRIYMEKVRSTLFLLREKQAQHRSILEIESFIDHAQRQMMQIKKRVLEGEVIPSSEKVYSLFEPYTEWLSKGKAGVMVELGLNVCVLEDKNGFILNHRVMKAVTDKEIAISFVSETKERYPNLMQCSLDKGFYSENNEQELGKIVTVVMPKPGKRSQERKSLEQEPFFVKAKRQHSAVESGIHALQAHGLDRCPDKGEIRFRKYVALGVLGHNMQKIGVLLLEREREKAQKNIKQKLAA